jgi:hypothetical protein
VTDPAQADPANAAALKEYGFNAAVEASYKREGRNAEPARIALR